MQLSTAGPQGDPVARRRIMRVLFVGVFMAALDAAIIAPAIPALQAIFAVDISQIGMITIVFSLCSLSSTALMASLSDRYGRRPIYLLCVAGFALSSLLIALAPTFGWLLLGRALQGFAAGGVTPTASAVVGDSFPAEERGKALGLIGATFGMAFLIGPLIASLILLVLGWQWIFLLNLPVAGLVLWLGARDLPKTPPPGVLPPFDWAGVLLLALLLTTLTLGINRVLDSALAVAIWPYLLGLAGLLLLCFVWVERRAVAPVVPLTLFATRQLVLTYLLCLCAGFGMGSVIYIAALAVAAYAIPAQQAGFLLVPLVLASTAGSVLFGRWLNQLGSRTVLLCGFGTLALGSLLLQLAAVGIWMFLLATVLLGLGVGIVVGGTLRTIVLNEVEIGERGAAQGLVNIGIAVGNLLVVAVLGAVADSQPGLAGLGLAYMVSGAVMLTALVLSLGLKPRSSEQAAMAGIGAAD